MALNFPSNPFNGQTYQSGSSATYLYNGTHWFIPSGQSGTSGTSGAQGPQGNQGTTGEIGPQGINGTAGSSGVQGPQGNQGATGSGTQGSQGPQGNQGASGTSGTNGSSGISVSASYMRGSRSTQQTTGLTTNSLVVFTQSDNSTGSDISLNTSTGQITLTAGKTYRLMGMVPNFTTSGGDVRPQFCWYNETTSAYVGSSAGAYIPSSAAAYGTFYGPAEAVITTNATTVLSLRFLVGSSSLAAIGGSGDFSTTGSYPWFDIEVISGNSPLVNGTSGTSGAQGSQGPAGTGAQGAQGTTGGTGPQGNQGTQGPQGNQGVQGTTFNINQYSGSVSITGSLLVSSMVTVSSSIVANTSSLYLTTGSNLYVQNNGLVEITGSLKVSGSTISLITSVLQVGTGSGDEGGELLLAKSQTNNSLTGSGITIDSYQNRLRIFEQGGNARGAYLDITSQSNTVGSEILTRASTDILATPIWTSAGAVTIGGTTTAPTKGTRTVDNISYRQLGAKQWEVVMTYFQTANTGAANGSGDYLFTLPNSLSFDMTIPSQTQYQSNVNANSWYNATYVIPSGGGMISNGATGGKVFPVVYSSTQFRILAINDSAWVKWAGSGHFQLADNPYVTIQLTFRFTSA